MYNKSTMNVHCYHKSLQCIEQLKIPTSAPRTTDVHGRKWSPFHPFRGRGWRRSQNGVGHKMRREKKKGKKKKKRGKRKKGREKKGKKEEKEAH